MLWAQPTARWADQRALGRRELLLDLHDLAVLDLVRVDHRDGLAVAHPAIAGVAGRQRGAAGLPRSRLTTAAAEILPIALATLPDFGTGSPMVASPITWMPWLLHRLVGDVVHLAPALVGADQVRLHRDGARALRRDQVDHVVLTRSNSVRTSRVPGSTPTTLLAAR